MNSLNNILKKSINDLIVSYKTGLDFLKIIEQECNDSGNYQSIAKNFDTIKSNEKLLSLYTSILRESLTISPNSSVDLNVPSIEGRRLDAIEQSPGNRPSIEGRSSSAIDESTVVDQERPVERKFDVTRQRRFTEGSVDLTNLSVRFQETVAVINSSTQNLRRKDNKLKNFNGKKKDSHLVAHYAQQVRDGLITFTKSRSTKRTNGMCFFCDEVKYYSKAQWQHHLISHTMENFFCCLECDLNFVKRKSHSTCSPNSIVNIYQRNNCGGDDYLAAFMCKVCNYVRVNERKLVDHLRKRHPDKYDTPANALRLYEKCKFVTNL